MAQRSTQADRGPYPYPFACLRRATTLLPYSLFLLPSRGSALLLPYSLFLLPSRGRSRAAPVRMPRRSCQTLHKRLDFYAKCTNISRFFPVTSCRGALCRIAENRGNVLAKWRIRRFWESLGYGIEIELFLVYNIHITQIEVWESKHPRASPRACRPRGIS